MANELVKHVENNLMTFLGKYKSQIETVLPRQMTPSRVLKLIIGAINRDPKLLQCTPMSVINAVLTAATMGLEIRPGSAYLVPFKNNKSQRLECTLLIDYRGKADLARRSGLVTDIDADVVYSRDMFKIVRDERGKRIEHEPCYFTRDNDGHMVPLAKEEERGIPIGAYAIAWMKEGPPHCVFMPKIDIEKIKARSRAKDNGPWVTDPLEMWKKTAVHRLCKMIPQSPELAASQEVDDKAEIDVSLDNLIDVAPEDDERPILPQSAEASAEVAAKRLEDMRAQGLTPVTQADVDKAVEQKRSAPPVQEDLGVSQADLPAGESEEEKMRRWQAEEDRKREEIGQKIASKPKRGFGGGQ